MSQMRSFSILKIKEHTKLRRLTSKLSIKYVDIKFVNFIDMSKAHYNVFLRLNNRKKSQTEIDFKKAKYPNQSLSWTLTNQERTERKQWCDEQFGEYGYVYGTNIVYDCGIIWFENENDHTVYRMRWL